MQGGSTTITISPDELDKSTPVSIAQGSGPDCFGAHRISDVQSLNGLTMPIRHDLTFAVDLPTAPDKPDQVYLAVYPGGESFAPMLIKATVNGKHVTATLPGASSTAHASASRAMLPHGAVDYLLEVPERLMYDWVAYFTTNTTSDAKFKITYPSDLDYEELSNIEIALAKVDPALASASVEPIPYPIEVNLLPSGPTVEPWGGNVLAGLVWAIDVNLSYMSFEAAENPASVDAKLAHLYVHLLEQLHAPFVGIGTDLVRTFYGTLNSWIWLDEALAVWQETQLASNYVPQEALDNRAFLTRHGLEYAPPPSVLGIPTGSDAPARQHGRGASMFLRKLPAQNVLRGVLSRREETQGESLLTGELATVQILPVDALRDMSGGDISSVWLKFCDDYTQNLVYPGQPVDDWTDDLVTHQSTQGIINKPGDTWRTVWNSPDLSANFYFISFPTPWPQDGSLQVTLSNARGDYGAALLYSVDSSHQGVDYIATMKGTATYTLHNAGTKFASENAGLLIVVANSHAETPYDSLSTFTLQVSAAGPSANYPYIYVDAGLITFYCGHGGFQWKLNFGFSTYTLYPTPKDIVPMLQWSGTGFFASGQLLLADANPDYSSTIPSTLDISGNLFPGPPAMLSIPALHFTGVSRGSGETLDFQLDIDQVPCTTSGSEIDCRVSVGDFKKNPRNYLVSDKVTDTAKDGSWVANCVPDLTLGYYPDDMHAIAVYFYPPSSNQQSEVKQHQ